MIRGVSWRHRPVFSQVLRKQEVMKGCVQKNHDTKCSSVYFISPDLLWCLSEVKMCCTLHTHTHTHTHTHSSGKCCSLPCDWCTHTDTHTHTRIHTHSSPCDW